VRQEFGLGVNAFLRLSGMSKSTYYRRRRQPKAGQSSSTFRPRPKQEAIREHAREVALAFPTYGYRKVWVELIRRGMVATESTVYRVLKQEGLLLPTKRRPKAKNQGPKPPKPELVGLVLSADSTLWRLVESKGSPALGGYASST